MQGYNYTHNGRYDEAILHFRKIQNSDVAMRDYLLFYLGKAYLSQQECPEARTVFRELLEGYPDSRWAPLAKVQVKSKEDCPALESEMVTQEKQEGCEGIRSASRKAACFFSSRQYKSAKEIYGEMAEKKNPSLKILTRLSQSAARSQDFETALEANKKILKRFPRTKAAKEALQKIAFLQQDAGHYREAIDALQELIKTTKSPYERRPYWERLAWCYFRLEEYEKAIEAFDGALALNETPFSLYWKARSFERLGKSAEARPIFQNLADIYSGNYYGIRALERLYRGNPPPSAFCGWWVKQSAHWQKTEVTLADSKSLERIYELTSLGLFSDATLEIRRLRPHLKLPLPNDPKKLKRKNDGDFYFDETSLSEENSDYPLPYAAHLFSEVKGAGVDPFLVFAMMRQESRFRESIVSPAGAIGLLQMMPGTGQRIAKEAGWQEYHPQWLYDPTTNIELAVRYVKKLSGIFDGKWYEIAAAYNAGERTVKEWAVQRKGVPEEEFIEEIPYPETKNYVKKVFENWKAYRFIYRGF